MNFVISIVGGLVDVVRDIYVLNTQRRPGLFPDNSVSGQAVFLLKLLDGGFCCFAEVSINFKAEPEFCIE